MTYAAVTAWGLIAGVTYTEQKTIHPGELLDLFVEHRQYDDEQHGLKRGTEDDHDIGAEDEEAFKEDEPDGGA